MMHNFVIETQQGEINPIQDGSDSYSIETQPSGFNSLSLLEDFKLLCDYNYDGVAHLVQQQSAALPSQVDGVAHDGVAHLVQQQNAALPSQIEVANLGLLKEYIVDDAIVDHENASLTHQRAAASPSSNTSTEIIGIASTQDVKSSILSAFLESELKQENSDLLLVSQMPDLEYRVLGWQAKINSSEWQDIIFEKDYIALFKSNLEELESETIKLGSPTITSLIEQNVLRLRGGAPAGVASNPLFPYSDSRTEIRHLSHPHLTRRNSTGNVASTQASRALTIARSGRASVSRSPARIATLVGAPASGSQPSYVKIQVSSDLVSVFGEVRQSTIITQAHRGAHIFSVTENLDDLIQKINYLEAPTVETVTTGLLKTDPKYENFKALAKNMIALIPTCEKSFSYVSGLSDKDILQIGFNLRRSLHKQKVPNTTKQAIIQPEMIEIDSFDKDFENLKNNKVWVNYSMGSNDPTGIVDTYSKAKTSLEQINKSDPTSSKIRFNPDHKIIKSIRRNIGLNDETAITVIYSEKINQTMSNIPGSVRKDLVCCSLITRVVNYQYSCIMNDALRLLLVKDYSVDQANYIITNDFIATRYDVIKSVTSWSKRVGCSEIMDCSNLFFEVTYFVTKFGEAVHYVEVRDFYDFSEKSMQATGKLVKAFKHLKSSLSDFYKFQEQAREFSINKLEILRREGKISQEILDVESSKISTFLDQQLNDINVHYEKFSHQLSHVVDNIEESSKRKVEQNGFYQALQGFKINEQQAEAKKNWENQLLEISEKVKQDLEKQTKNFQKQPADALSGLETLELQQQPELDLYDVREKIQINEYIDIELTQISLVRGLNWLNQPTAKTSTFLGGKVKKVELKE